MVRPEVSDGSIVDLLENFVATSLAVLLAFTAILNSIGTISSQTFACGAFTNCSAIADAGQFASPRACSIRNGSPAAGIAQELGGGSAGRSAGDRTSQIASPIRGPRSRLEKVL
jgi:hypothetical protein